MLRNIRALKPFAGLALVATAVSGCSVYKLTGDVMAGYSSEKLVPYLMRSGDVNMACQTGVSLGSFLSSFEDVGAKPDRAALVSLVSAAICAEASAWEAELRRLRATHARNAAEAEDALSEEMRAHELAARRYAEAYQRLSNIVGPVGQGTCPELKENTQLFYLLGLSAGVMAVMHDKAAGGAAGVSTDIPATVERAAACLPADSWWGVPSALQAAIWAAAPPLAPPGGDPWAKLAAAVKQGSAAHVRLAGAFEVQAEMTAGRRDAAEKSITAFAAAEQATPSDPKWSLLDTYGGNIVRHESDKIWTEATGHRTPFGELGTFPEASTPATQDADPFRE